VVDDVGRKLAGGRLGLHARDELAARRTHHLDPHEGEALVEGLDDLLLNLGEVCGVEDELAFLSRRLDQLGRAEGILLRRCRECEARQCECADGLRKAAQCS
jgi:hypothetical protein